MINQTLDNITNNVNNNNENTISFYPEYKVLKKIENKRSSVDAIGNNNNLNLDLNNNIQPTKWVQLNKITTNKPPKSTMKLGDLLKDDS